MTTIAAFDFDGTLTERDSVVPFLGRLARRPAVLGRAVTQVPAAAAALVRRDRDRLRAVATRAVLTGVSAARLATEGDRFAADIVAARLRADTRARLAWHIAEGHRVVLVSASYESYLVGVAAELGVEAVLATRLEVVDGVCTGRLDGANCRGHEKVRRLHGWLAAEGLARDDVTVWAYGDSAGDRELLADADHAVWAGGRLDSVFPS